MIINFPDLTYSHASKAKALAYFRDNAITDVNVPITKQGILHVKVTIINGRVSFLSLHKI